MAKLYVVPTPVGNLEDMTFRAISVLREVDCILAEDTRTSGILLKHFDIHTRMQSHHKFNEHQTIEGIVSRIEGGENIALISDAGTPAMEKLRDDARTFMEIADEEMSPSNACPERQPLCRHW